MRRKNLWLRLSSCTMAALIATTSVVPVAAAEVDYQDEASVETEETAEPEEVITEESIHELYGIDLKVAKVDGRKFVLTV